MHAHMHIDTRIHANKATCMPGGIERFRAKNDIFRILAELRK